MTYKIIDNINAVQENIIIKPAPEPTVRRLLVYLEYLKSIEAPLISSGQIAERFNFTAIQIRKDISFTGYTGRPKHGYNRLQLIEQIEKFLGFNDKIDVFLIGAGNIGRALAEYKGFEKYSLNIIALADNNPELYNTTVAGKKIFPVEKALELIKRLKIKMAIIAVPPPANQTVSDLLVKAGIKAIWNFSSARLKCPYEIIVQNEDLGASLSVLAQKLLSAEQTGRKSKI